MSTVASFIALDRLVLIFRHKTHTSLSQKSQQQLLTPLIVRYFSHNVLFELSSMITKDEIYFSLYKLELFITKVLFSTVCQIDVKKSPVIYYRILLG